MSVAIATALLGTATLGVAAAYAGSNARGAAQAGAPDWVRRHGGAFAAVLAGAQLVLVLGHPSPGAGLAILLSAWTVAGWAYTHFAGAWPAATWRTGWYCGLALLAGSVLAALVPWTPA